MVRIGAKSTAGPIISKSTIVANGFGRDKVRRSGRRREEEGVMRETLVRGGAQDDRG